MGVIDKNAPIRSRQISNKNSPWVTNEIRRLMFRRDYLKSGLSYLETLAFGVNIDSCDIAQIMRSKRLNVSTSQMISICINMTSKRPGN